MSVRRGARAERAAVVTMEPGPARWDGLRRLAAGCGVPVHVALVSAIQLLLRRYTGEADVVLGLPLAAGMVALRQDVSGDVTVASLLRATAAALAEAAAHPVHGRGPFPVLVTIDALVAPGAGERAPRADLELLLSSEGDRPRVTFVHDPAALPEALVDCLRRDLLTLLDELPDAAGRPALGLLARPAMEERRPRARLLAGDLEGSVPARFLEQVHRAPEATAVVGEDGDLTYAALASRAAAVAAAVRGAGRVGLLLDHGPATIEAILGVLAAGAAYVPLDPTYPAERLAFMAGSSGVDAIVTGAAHAPLARSLRPGVPVIDAAASRDAALALPAPGGADSLAYVLYTSGSTGRPKGVMQDHRGVLFQVRAHTAEHGITAADRLSLVSSFSFDAAVTDLFGALLNGAAVVPFDVRRHGVGRLAAALAERRVTVLHATPTVYRHLLASLEPGETLPDVRLVLLGGEEVTAADVELGRRHLPDRCVIVNGYGATEISFALRGPAEPEGAGVPLGWPLDGVEVALVAPDGWPACLRGEIEVRSRHVALGYWGDPALTAERFTPRPGGARAYRTGDVGRRLPDGRIAFAGRRDRQVKVRGNRVELGEVEAALAALPEVAAAVAVPRARGIAAYVVPAAGARAEPEALRRALERTLPAFAVPAAIAVLDRLPLTPTGKVDVRALPEPAAATSAGRPLDRVERAVADAWCAALGRPEVGPDDRFFDVGGDSLLMAGVQRRVERALGVEVPLHRLFEHPTVASLAAYLRDGGDPGHGEELDLVEARMRRRARARTAR